MVASTRSPTISSRLVRTFHRPLGGRHARHRHGRLQRQVLVRQSRHSTPSNCTPSNGGRESTTAPSSTSSHHRPRCVLEAGDVEVHRHPHSSGSGPAGVHLSRGQPRQGGRLHAGQRKESEGIPPWQGRSVCRRQSRPHRLPGGPVDAHHSFNTETPRRAMLTGSDQRGDESAHAVYVDVTDANGKVTNYLELTSPNRFDDRDGERRPQGR